ncbi:cyclin-dependent kinase inhibitor 1 [Scaptodrosophila lebanonensis]|uniref:Cyclin-dependent kinase inhibitor 1 n=1 Tax=Drosophila lebanonensis TaxID=7225 RepID=A0A6J2UK46_DROLE|nr:cyclin-dependent kinase inhibitor 1 [Scaptodrosophila lebanonensis]
MVSARVLNPVVLSEFCRMSPAINRNFPCRKLNRVKRDLFGTAHSNISSGDAAKNNRHFNAELERHQEQATQKWGFDFRSGCPLSVSSTFVWERVSSQESTIAPEMYTLTRAAHVRPEPSEASDLDLLLNERADREHVTNSSLESTTDNESGFDSLLMDFPMPSSNSASNGSSTSTGSLSCSPPKRQLKITEFMKERKRLAQAPKKISPAKRLRTSSGSSHSSSMVASSLNAFLGGQMKRRRNN